MNEAKLMNVIYLQSIGTIMEAKVMRQQPVFLSAEWRTLLMLNYEIEPAVLQPLVPAGTELDTWRGRTYVSVVGFMFLHTRLLGIPIPFHRNFEELNLRFYVRRRGPEGWRRGVVFVKELVPKWAIAAVARWAYNENYHATSMGHAIDTDGGHVEFSWWWRKRPFLASAAISGDPQPIRDGSEEEFITEHYWGYARQRDGGAVEYRVEHPRWRVWQADDYHFRGDVATLYGPEYAAALTGTPTSVFVADGSDVIVRRGRRI
jgi:hypothetical protein